ncbi:hypothetical protein IU458_33690 [Nocardia nova]|nr:hypothetical protein [Nocardia nova]
MAVILFVLVLSAIQKGLSVQDSTRSIVDNFRTTNEMFSERADLAAPATARRQLDELKEILAQLNSVASADVDHLAALLPNASALRAAGESDVQIAAQLQGMAATLADAATSLHRISAAANTTVSEINDELGRALELVAQLNAELTRTTNKLAPLPAQDAVIPAPGGN